MKRTLKRNEMDIDEILKQYLPHATDQEVDAASEKVLKRIRSMRFQQANTAPAVAKEPINANWFMKFHVALLMAVEQLQGNGRPVTITLKLEELLEEKMVSGSAVFLVLLMFERLGLVSSSPINPEKPDMLDMRYFEITAAGRQALAKALAKHRAVMDPQEGFA
jgi:hypothetical protein